MAKLAVLISTPKMCTTHCPESFAAVNGIVISPIGGIEELDWQGFVRSESNTPFSLANCSKVIGMNDPNYRYKHGSSDVSRQESELSILMFLAEPSHLKQLIHGTLRNNISRY
jgi:hypothetical protein